MQLLQPANDRMQSPLVELEIILNAGHRTALRRCMQEGFEGEWVVAGDIGQAVVERLEVVPVGTGSNLFLVEGKGWTATFVEQNSH